MSYVCFLLAYISIILMILGFIAEIFEKIDLVYIIGYILGVFFIFDVLVVIIGLGNLIYNSMF